MLEELKIITEKLFRSVLSISAKNSGTFRLLITARIGEMEKPLLIVGNAHSDIEDGHVIAVFNPDEDIIENVYAGCVYMGDQLKDIVGGKCDAMLDLWIDAYKKDSVSEISSYKSRTPKDAKFKIQ